MLVKPILSSSKIIDATKSNLISFTVVGGDQFSVVNYSIYNNSTSALITSQTITSQASSFYILSNVLTNGIEYRMTVRTGDSSGNFSEYSDYMIIKCYSSAIVTIGGFTIEDNINKVKNQKFIFNGNYTQAQNVILKYFKYILYDANNIVVKEYPVTYQQSGTLEQLIDGLQNYTWYKIELLCVDQNDTSSSSGLISFYVDYLPPKIRQVVNLTNDSTNATVIIEGDIRQLNFLTSGTVSFENSSYVNINATNSYIYMDDAFTLHDNFVLDSWVISCKKDANLITLIDIDSNDKIVIRYQSDNRIHVIKNIGTIIMEYVSDVVDVGSNQFLLRVKQKDRRMDAIIQII